jgi:hypothetical protein
LRIERGARLDRSVYGGGSGFGFSDLVAERFHLGHLSLETFD